MDQGKLKQGFMTLQTSTMIYDMNVVILNLNISQK